MVWKRACWQKKRLGTPSLGYTMSYVAIMPLGVREQPLTIQFDASATKGTLIGASEGDMQFLSAEAWRPWYPVAKSLWANYYFHLGQKALNRLFHRRSADSGLRIGLRPSDSGLELTTAPPSFAYALSYCPLTVAAAGNYRFELKYRRHHGDVTFGALSEDKTEWLAQAWSGDAPFASEKPGVLVTSFTVRLTAGQTVILMLANNNPGTDTPSRVVIEDVRAYRDISSEGADCQLRQQQAVARVMDTAVCDIFCHGPLCRLTNWWRVIKSIDRPWTNIYNSMRW